MAIVFAIKKWRPYIIGKQFVVQTDQHNLCFLLEQRVVEAEYQKWILKLMPYNFTIQYKPGNTNLVADALSKAPSEASLSLLTTPIIKDFEELKEMVVADSFLANIQQAVQQDPKSHPGFSLVAGHLYYQGKLVIPIASPYVPLLLNEFHNSVVAGHVEIRRTYNRLAAEFYWKGMKKIVQQFVRACDSCQKNKSDTCQKNKNNTTTPGELLQPLPIHAQVWEDITMDFIEGLPKSKGYSAILVVVDRLTKYAHFEAIEHPYTTASIAKVFIQEVVHLHGIPRSIISDRDPIFMSLFWRELFSLQGSELRQSSAN